LLPPDPALATAIAARLKLSNKARKRLASAAEPALDSTPRALAYRLGTENAVDRLLLAGDPAAARAIAGWQPPRLGVGGGDLIARGVPQGPRVAATLHAIEREWIAAGFPDGAALDRLVSSLLAREP
jgi:poly(A) polymerase